jgi:hypothetical protein
MAMPIVKMIRGNGKPGEIRVYERDVPAYESRGWEVADGTSTRRLPELKTVDENTADEDGDEPFDWAQTEAGDR